MTLRPWLVATLLALAAAPAAAQTPGFFPIARSPDGTVMLIDSASLSRSGDARFVSTTVTRFSAEAASQVNGDRMLKVEELDCAARRSRGWTNVLFREDQVVARDSLSSRWADVDTASAGIFDAACDVLRRSFAAALPVQLEADEADSMPSLNNASAVVQALSRGYPIRLRDRAVSGSAMIRVRIAEDGSVAPEDVRVVWATRPEFAEAARRLGSVMRFTPARVRGRPVAVGAVMPVEFQVQR